MMSPLNNQQYIVTTNHRNTGVNTEGSYRITMLHRTSHRITAALEQRGLVLLEGRGVFWGKMFMFVIGSEVIVRVS